MGLKSDYSTVYDASDPSPHYCHGDRPISGGSVGGVAAGGSAFAWLEEVRTSAGPGRSTEVGMVGMVSRGDWVW